MSCFEARFKKKVVLLGILVFSALVWGIDKVMDPYEGIWLNRLLFQKSFNFDVAVNFTFDGKPYRIERTVSCYRKVTYSAYGSKKQHGWFPRYRAFGIEVDTGEGVIVATPAACDASRRDWPRGADPQKARYNWYIDVPETHTPLMMVTDDPDNPQQIIIYASRQAYKAPKARLQYKDMTLAPAKGLGRWFADGPDRFAYYGNPKFDEMEDKSRQDWWSMSFAPLGRDVWGQNEEIVQAVSGKSGLVQLDHRVRTLINNIPGYCQDFSYPLLGDGVMDGSSLGGGLKRPQNCGLLYQHLVPFVEGEDHVWRPDYDRQGMDIIYPMTEEWYAKHLQLVSEAFEVNGTKVQFSFEARLTQGLTKDGETVFYFSGYDRPSFYDAKHDLIYHRAYIFWNNITHKF